DYGDLPAPYAVTLLENGAKHDLLGGGPVLGSLVDSESDGTHSAQADADDLAGSDDEDGVTFSSALVQGQGASVDVVVTNVGSGAYLDAWMDFDASGDF